MSTKKGGRTTPKKTDLEQRFADSGMEATELTAEEADRFGQPDVRIPAREAQIKVQAINDDYLLFTFAADNGMSVNNYTVSREQLMVILEGVEPWFMMALEQPTVEEIPVGLSVVKRDTTLVGADGRPLT